MADRPFRFGVTNGFAVDGPRWLDAARAAESLGYSTFLLPDTIGTPAPLPALAMAAAVTTTLRVGTWVLCDPLRPARQVAWEAGTLHRLSGGRFELGIGAGRPGAERDAAQFGVGYGSPGERVNRLVESVGVIRAELGPDVPLLIAASGPRLLRLAGDLADTVALGWPPRTNIEAARAIVETVHVGGRRSELAAGLIAVGDDESPWLARMGVTAAELASAGAVTVVTGDAEQMADQLRERRAALGISYWTVPAQSMVEFAPVVARLAGE